jgi:hypothetical protein
MAIPSWDRATSEDWLGRWAMNLMLINVSTRRFGRAVRLPEGDVPAEHGSGLSKSAASRRFVALSSEKLDTFMNADLSIWTFWSSGDGLHVTRTSCCSLPSASTGTATSIRSPWSKARLRTPQPSRRSWTTSSSGGSIPPSLVSSSASSSCEER